MSFVTSFFSLGNTHLAIAYVLFHFYSVFFTAAKIQDDRPMTQAHLSLPLSIANLFFGCVTKLVSYDDNDKPMVRIDIDLELILINADSNSKRLFFIRG